MKVTKPGDREAEAAARAAKSEARKARAAAAKKPGSRKASAAKKKIGAKKNTPGRRRAVAKKGTAAGEGVDHAPEPVPESVAAREDA